MKLSINLTTIRATSYVANISETPDQTVNPQLCTPRSGVLPNAPCVEETRMCVRGVFVVHHHGNQTDGISRSTRAIPVFYLITIDNQWLIYLADVYLLLLIFRPCEPTHPPTHHSPSLFSLLGDVPLISGVELPASICARDELIQSSLSIRRSLRMPSSAVLAAAAATADRGNGFFRHCLVLVIPPSI